MRNRWILCVTVVCLCVPAAWGQQASVNWENLTRVERGHRVQVVQTDLKSTRGKFLSFSDTELVVEVDKTQVTIPREKVFRVSEDHPRGRNALYAAIAGAGVGAGIGALASREFHGTSDKAAIVLACSGSWAGIFAGVSALATRNPTVYRAEAAPAVDAKAAK